MRAVIFSGLALAATCSLASAQVLVSDDFSYSAALTANGWVAHSGAGNKVIMANGSVATIDFSSGSGEDVNLGFTPQGATDVTYFSFTLNVPSGSPVTPDGNGSYFIHLKNSGNFFHARIGLLSAAAAGDFGIGISNSSNIGGSGGVWGSDLSFNTNYAVVASWDAATDTATMWIDPASSSDTSAVSVGTFTGDSMEAIALRQSGDHTGFITVDDVTVGKTFGDVSSGGGGPNTGAAGCDGSSGTCPCFGVGLADQGCPNSASVNGAKLAASGDATITSDTFSMAVTEAALLKPGLVLSGTTDLSPGINTVADSAGLLCVGGSTQRGDVVFTDASGNASLPDFQGALYGAAGNVSAGALATYQYWYRDPNTSCAPNDTAAGDFNFSNLWGVTWLP
jgi:hypothetical protein